MELNTASVDELEARAKEIVGLVDAASSLDEIETLSNERTAIDAELEQRKAVEAAKVEVRTKIAEGTVGTTTKEFDEVTNMSESVITRNSPEYVHAFAEYVKSGNDTECRSLLTENASGTVAVPEIVQTAIAHAWDNEGVASLLKKTAIKGNIKQGFELSAEEAAVHAEGSGAVTEEDLKTGVVTMVPETIKKWVSFSDEVLDIDDGNFLAYIYEEITHKMAEKIAALFIEKVVAAPTASNKDACGQASITEAASVATVAHAVANLSDEATNPVIVMNKLTYASFKDLQYSNKYGVDPFEGLTVVFNNTLKAYSAAESGDCYMIVGDFGKGGQANFPNGDSITFKLDDVTLATSDLVKVIGREPVALGIVAPKCFTRVCK